MVVITDIISQHIEEAAFLQLLKIDAFYEPHYSLKDLSKLEERLEANLDGLRIAGEPGWQLCLDELLWQEPGEIFTAASMAFETQTEERYRVVRDAIGDDVELSKGFISALGWLPDERALPYINHLLKSDNPLDQRMGLAGAAIHRHDIGTQLVPFLTAEDQALRARALKAAGELGRRDLGPHLLNALQDPDPACRFYAAWSAALLGANNLGPVFQQIALEGGLFAERAVCMAARTLPIPTAYTWLRQLHDNQEYTRLSIIGQGRSGNPAHMPFLIEDMAVDEYARIAGEAFSMITGVDIAYDDLEGEWPEGFEAGPTEDPEDEDVDMDADEDLPWPEPSLIADWWEANRHSYKDGVRHLCGQELSDASLYLVLRDGFQRQRIAAAHELAIRHPESPLFEYRAPAWRQLKWLEGMLSQ